MYFKKVDPATGGASPGFSRGSDKYSKNQWSGHSNDGRLVDFARGPTVGNASSSPKAKNTPGNPTKDPHQMTVATAGPAKVVRDIGGVDRVKPKNLDYINGGAQYRGVGGTTVKGYKNPDKINMNGYTMGDGQVVKGSRPVAAGQMDNVNYGPAKQYPGK